MEKTEIVKNPNLSMLKNVTFKDALFIFYDT